MYDAAGNVVQITRSAAAPQADLIITSLSVGTVVLVGNGQYNIPVNFTVKNVGSGTSTATWYDYGYLSTNGILNNNDQALNAFNIRGLDLAPGTSYSVVTTFYTNTGTAPGNYTLIVKADGGASASGQYGPNGGNRVAEADETNNTRSAAINLSGPDLTISNLTVGAITINTSGSFIIPATFQVNNVGNGAAKASWSDYGYLSSDAQLDSSDQLLSNSNARSTDLAAGASYTANVTFTTTTSTRAGAYYLIVKTDTTSPPYNVLESNEQNNTQSLLITLPAPDLTVSNLTLGSISVNQDGSYNLPVTFQVNNIGGLLAKASWYDRGYLSDSAALHDSDQVLASGVYHATNLAAGANYTVNVTFRTNATTPPGAHYLIVKADGGVGTSGANTPTGPNLVAEIDETNNAQSLLVTLPSRPDLSITNLVVGTITMRTGGGFNIPVTFQVNNIGQSAAKATWYDYGYMSNDLVLDDSDEVLGGYNTRTTELAAGASYTVSTTLTTSTTTLPGTRTLFVKADGGPATSGQYSHIGPNYVTEANESNNTQVTTVLLPGPDLTLSNLAVGIITENQNGSYNVPVTFQVNNIGTAAATATWYDFGYLSADGILNDTDQVLAGYSTHSTDLSAGASYTVSKTFTTSAATPAGAYRLIVKADGGSGASGQYSPTGRNYVAEVDETNNTQSLAITLPAKPDLTLGNLSVGAITANQNGSYNISATFTVTNIGVSTAKATWYDRGYLSVDAVLQDTDEILASGNTRSTDLAPAASYAATVTLTTSAATAPGPYTLFVKADGGNSVSGVNAPTGPALVAEANESNNVQAIAITLPTKPDLTVSNLRIGPPITVAQNGAYSFPVSFTVTNSGVTAAAPNWYDVGYLSTDGVLDNGDVALAGYRQQTVALAAGASYTINGTFTTAATTAPGTYTLFVKADGRWPGVGGTNTDNGKVVEANETNNTQAASLTLPTKPDLTVSNLSIGTPITVAQNGAYSFPVSYTVTNIGATDAAPSWYDVGYLSTDGVFDNTDVALAGYRQQTVALAAGASYTINGTFTTAATTAPGTYTLFVKADGRWPGVGGTNTDNGKVVEANETNNTQAASLTLPTKPDLTVTIVSVGTIVKNGNNSYSIPITWTVTNNGGATAQPNWYDVGYLSADAALNNGDLVVGYLQHTMALATGASYTVSGTYITLTTTAPGTYTLFLKADGKGGALGGTNTDNGAVAEVNETNNTGSATVVLP